MFEFAPRTGTSVAPAIAAETVRLVETKKKWFFRSRNGLEFNTDGFIQTILCWFGLGKKKEILENASIDSLQEY